MAKMARLDVRYYAFYNDFQIIPPLNALKSLNPLNETLTWFMVFNCRVNVDPKAKVERQERRDIR